MTVGSPPTGSSADECEDGERPKKGTDDLIIKMLEKYLHINSDIEENEKELNAVIEKCPKVLDNIKDFTKISTKKPAQCIVYNIANIIGSYW